MKTLKHIIVFVFAIGFLNANAQEKKIKFNKGTLKICSTKNFQIEGYNGDEIIIKPIHQKRGSYNSYSISQTSGGSHVGHHVGGVARVNGMRNLSSTKKSDTVITGVFYSNNNERKKGLKKLGENINDDDLGIYFEIQKSDGELIFRDKRQNQLIMVSGEKYQIKIPNSLKLNWMSGDCTSNLKKSDNRYVFYSSDSSEITNFEGEVVINSTMRNTKLVDVSGPVSLNSLGGNFTIIFDKKQPSQLYSVYTNNGFIDITMPEKSSLNVLAVGKSIYSDLDFKILSEKEINDFGHKNQEMKLKLNSGTVKMNLNAGYGDVFLRKK